MPAGVSAVVDSSMFWFAWCCNRVRRRYVSTSAPGGAGCAAHGRASPSRLSRPSRATLVKRSESRAGRESVPNGAAAPRPLAPPTARLGCAQMALCAHSASRGWIRHLGTAWAFGVVVNRRARRRRRGGHDFPTSPHDDRCVPPLAQGRVLGVRWLYRDFRRL